MKTTNSLWNFFAAVKLALFTLCALAITSIIGTIIPQKESLSFYAEKYGAKTAQFFKILDIPDMYNSWWFIGLLLLLSLNLIICSIDRFPNVWKQIRLDNLQTPVSRIEKMSTQAHWSNTTSGEFSPSSIFSLFNHKGWKVTSKEVENGTLFFSQKYAWSRTGVYIVHVSILIIFIGAIIGALTGFKGSIMIPELQSSSKIFAFDTGAAIDLGFEIQCNSFGIEFYKNGMPKEYRSSLTVLEGGKEILTKSIEVNSPLTYKGITFYQSSYQGYQDFVISIKNKNSNLQTSFITSFQKQEKWSEEGIKVGIINAETAGDRIVRAKIWFDDEFGTPSIFWMDMDNHVTVQRGEKEYLLSTKQMYATGLQVAKDPGVWVVYIGCGLMILGLYFAFFLSHQRIWLYVHQEGAKTHFLLAGSANKNRSTFDKIFTGIEDDFKKSLS